MDIATVLTERPTVSQFIETIGSHLPLLRELKSCPQDPVWHAEGDVHIHTDMVLQETYDIIEKEASYLSEDSKFVLVMAALLHDIAKPLVTKTAFLEREQRDCVIAPKHEIRGVSYLSHRLGLLEIPSNLQEYILGLVGYHQIPKLLVIKDASSWKYQELSQKASCELLYWLEVADMRGRTCVDKASQLEYLELFKLYCQEYNCFKKTAIPEISADPFVSQKGFKALLEGDIYLPEEASSKFYEASKSYSHLVVMTGLSGVGKSSYIAEHYSDYLCISLDSIRESLGDRQDMSQEGLILRTAKDQMKVALAKKQNIVYDATNIRKDFRGKVLDLGMRYGALTEIVYIKDSLDAILKRDATRKHSVGEKVIREQDSRFEVPEMSETDKLTVVNVYQPPKLKPKKKMVLM